MDLPGEFPPADVRTERFVKLVVSGGLALVAGLWLTALFAQGSPRWLVGVALAALGVAGLAAGIYDEVELSAAG